MEMNLNKIDIKNLLVDTSHGGVKKSDAWDYFGKLILKKDGRSKHIVQEKVFCALCIDEAKKKIGGAGNSDNEGEDFDMETPPNQEHAFGRYVRFFVQIR